MTSGFEFIIEKNKILFFFKIKKKRIIKISRENKKQVITHHSSLLISHFVNIEFFYKLTKIQSIMITKTYNKSMLFWFQAKVMSDE